MRVQSAKLWRRILNTDPDVLFGPESSRLLNRNWGDRLAQPGYMGRRYRPGGLVFVSMNPGAGPQGGMSAEDQRQYGALEHLRDADDLTVSARFDELTDALADIMPGWKIWQNFVAPVLDATGRDWSEVAYVNLLKWRTAASSGLARLYARGWDHHTREQIELLKPGRVVAIGTGAGRSFIRHYTGQGRLRFHPARHRQQRGAGRPRSAGQNRSSSTVINPDDSVA